MCCQTINVTSFAEITLSTSNPLFVSEEAVVSWIKNLQTKELFSRESDWNVLFFEGTVDQLERLKHVKVSPKDIGIKTCSFYCVGNQCLPKAIHNPLIYCVYL